MERPSGEGPGRGAERAELPEPLYPAGGHIQPPDIEGGQRPGELRLQGSPRWAAQTDEPGGDGVQPPFPAAHPAPGLHPDPLLRAAGPGVFGHLSAVHRPDRPLPALAEAGGPVQPGSAA